VSFFCFFAPPLFAAGVRRRVAKILVFRRKIFWKLFIFRLILWHINLGLCDSLWVLRKFQSSEGGIGLILAPKSRPRSWHTLWVGCTTWVSKNSHTIPPGVSHLGFYSLEPLWCGNCDPYQPNSWFWPFSASVHPLQMETWSALTNGLSTWYCPERSN